jgi:hypothetical protein
MGGIGLQQFFIFVFLGLAIRLHTQLLTLERNGTGKKNWRPLLFTLYASLGLISVRKIFFTRTKRLTTKQIRIFFRLFEFSAGRDADKNPLPFHEVYFYVFEAVPMFFALAAMNVVHPGATLVGPDADMPGLKTLLCGWRRKQNTRMEWNTMERKTDASYSQIP